MTKPPLKIRGFREDDLPFIKNSFLLSFRNSFFTLAISNPTYYGVYAPLLEDLLYQENTTVAVAVNPEDHNHIYGWLLWEYLGKAQVLHYVYVKEAYRRFGIASDLLKQSGFDAQDSFFYTLASRESGELKKNFRHAVHNPFLLLTPNFPKPGAR